MGWYLELGAEGFRVPKGYVGWSCDLTELSDLNDDLGDIDRIDSGEGVLEVSVEAQAGLSHRIVLVVRLNGLIEADRCSKWHTADSCVAQGEGDCKKSHGS